MVRILLAVCLLAVVNAATVGRRQQRQATYQIPSDGAPLDVAAATGSSQYGPGVRQQRQAGYRPQGRPNYVEDESPKPYSFDFETQGEDGGFSSRRETGDGTGRIVGSYIIKDIDGRERTVEYEADAAGFRAFVRTNEYGTESKNPADVVIESSAPTAQELAYQAGPKPAGGRGKY